MMKKIFYLLLLIFILNLNLITAHAAPSNTKTVKSKVIKIISTPETCTDLSDEKNIISESQIIQVKILEGNHKNEVLQLQSGEFILDLGDIVNLCIGEENGTITSANVYQFVRTKFTLYIIIFFAIIMLLVGGLKGLKSIITLGFTAYSVLFVLPKLIIKGYNPILLTIALASLITILTLTIVNGFNSKSYAAILGTIGGVIISGLISVFMGNILKFSGLAGEQQRALMYIPKTSHINFSQLLYAGILLGALGAVMDVCTSISSVIHEIKLSNKNANSWFLFKSGMSVGKDIIGTMSNTLILAYAGASMSVIITFMAYDSNLAEILNQEVISVEIIRSLAGSIGLILSVPLTAFIASSVAKKPRM